MDKTNDDSVDAFLGRVRRAWDAGDAQAYGEQFTGDASYVTFLGDVLFGRAEIVRIHHDVFTKWQDPTRMIVTPVTVRPIEAGSVVVVTAGGVGPGDKIDYDKFQTYTLQRDDTGRWQCVAFQNTGMSQGAKEDIQRRGLAAVKV